MQRVAPLDPDYKRRIQDSFSRQSAMALMGIKIARVEPGLVELTLPFRADLTQQNGFLHAGVVTALADTASGYAALTLMPAGKDVLTVEFKVNLLRPAMGQHFFAVATVIKPGRTLTITRADVFAVSGSDQELVAAMQATMISL